MRYTCRKRLITYDMAHTLLRCPLRTPNLLNTLLRGNVIMSTDSKVVAAANRPPVTTLAVLVAVFVAGLFAMGFDQGHLFSLAQGSAAFDQPYLHELMHDARHAAGFPCH